ncbi:hypothetical protein FOPG_18387 [Fusarium oxysporum f. sp. conglutinans race 2 54008]|uniref:Uncharacterized protein n=1 Tax=Fusarium oxysporum f. sp. conglutinans race 2 54008 TaxID=1089457 RepID=X0GZZ0_FUSOX|nr:hypothetical protein FOPG_18387 [Fusarium oxysporum f. sp. conglutinans race 2 54008]
MVRPKTFHFIDQRLQQTFGDNQRGHFGGRSILLRGDFYQLLPAFENSLNATGFLGHEVETTGQNAYRAFEQTVELKQVVRR